MRSRLSPLLSTPRRWRLLALVLVGLPFVSARAQQTYSLGALANRAESIPTVDEAAASSLDAQRRRYAGDLGLSIEARAVAYPGIVTNSATGQGSTAASASLDLVWDLLQGGLGEALYERRRLSALQDVGAQSARVAREDARTAVRLLALALLQDETRGAGAREAAALANTAAERYNGLFESRDVLRSTLLDARLRAQRYEQDALRFETSAARIRDELARQLRIDPTFRVERPEGMPRVDAADLDYSARVGARRYVESVVPPQPALSDVQLTLFAGVQSRESYFANDNTGGVSFRAGPRFGARVRVPLSTIGRFAAYGRERAALMVQQEARYDAALRTQMTRVNNALTALRLAEGRYNELRTTIEIAQAELEEARLQASEGLRLTANEVLLLEARVRENTAEAEAQRLEAWKQYYILQQLAGLPG